MNYYTENLKKPKNTTYEPLTQFQNLYVPYKQKKHQSPRCLTIQIND